MDAASKAAQAEARAKSKTPTKPVPPKTASLFDVPATAFAPTAAPAESKENDEPFVEIEDDEQRGEYEDLDQADAYKLLYA